MLILYAGQWESFFARFNPPSAGGEGVEEGGSGGVVNT